MAITDVVVPQLSESVSEATLLTWKKKPGEAVTADEILIEVETDKVVLEVPAPVSGVFTEIVRADGSMVVAGEVIARIDTAGKAAAVTAAPASTAAAAPAPVSAPIAASVGSAGVASPAAAKILAEKAWQRQTSRAQAVTVVSRKAMRLVLRQPLLLLLQSRLRPWQTPRYP